MELFPAGNDAKWRLIQRVIDECDYYVLVVGGKYGSIDPTTELSYTEMEFDYADSIGKPVMAFLHGEPGQLKGDQIELDEERRTKLDAFRAKVESSRVVKYWTKPEELPGHVALALMETREQSPAEGWIRASNAMTPEARTEVAELRAIVAELTQQAGARGAIKAVADDLADGEDIYPAAVKVSGYHTDDVTEDRRPKPGVTSTYVWTVGLELTWNEILQAVGPTLLHEASEPEIRKSLTEWLKTRWKEDRPDDLGRVIGSIDVVGEIAEDIVVQFFALGIIERGVKKRTVSDRGKYWVLTDAGQDQMMKLRAIRK